MGASEDGFLHTLRRIVDSGETRADELLRKYRGEWGGDVRKVFSEYAY
jgi:glutamate--cysteine ligase